MNARRPVSSPITACIALTLAVLAVIIPAGCGRDTPANPRDLLLGADDFTDTVVATLSISEEQLPGGVSSAQVELQGSGFRVLQSLVLYNTREQALTALDGIRADLVNRRETGPGEPEASGILQHQLGSEAAASLFFIKNQSLVRLTVTGPNRDTRLTELADIARGKLAES